MSSSPETIPLTAPTHCPSCSNELVPAKNGDYSFCADEKCKRWTYFGVEDLRQVTIKIDEHIIYVCIAQGRTEIDTISYSFIMNINKAETSLITKTDDQIRDWLKTFMAFQ